MSKAEREVARARAKAAVEVVHKPCRVVTVTLEGLEPKQYALRLGKALTFGSHASCGVNLDGAAKQPVQVTLVARSTGPDESKSDDMDLKLECTQGIRLAFCDIRSDPPPYQPVGKKPQPYIFEFGHKIHMQVPRTGKDPYEIVIRQIGDNLPSPYDDRLQTGRWLYISKLGEGLVGLVYRAREKTQEKYATDVAIKLLKAKTSSSKDEIMRKSYCLHRETQWSLQWLHNPKHEKYDAEKAKYFMQYLEDHTGPWCGFGSIEESIQYYSRPRVEWRTMRQVPSPPEVRHVVMELVEGRTLHETFVLQKQGRDVGLTKKAKQRLAEQLTQAVDYLVSFRLIHRDIRNANIMFDREGNVKLVDLGHTIIAECKWAWQRSTVLRCQWDDDDVKGKIFDWAPDEVKRPVPEWFDLEEKTRYMNFWAGFDERRVYRMHSFDVYSLGVIFLELEYDGDIKKVRDNVIAYKGENECRLQEISYERIPTSDAPVLDLLPKDFMWTLLGEPEDRPTPARVLQQLRRGARGAGSRSPRRARSRSPSRARSRSRSRSFGRSCSKSTSSAGSAGDEMLRAGLGAWLGTAAQEEEEEVGPDSPGYSQDRLRSDDEASSLPTTSVGSDE